MNLSKSTLTFVTLCSFALVLAACGGASTESPKTNQTNTALGAQNKTEIVSRTATVKQSTPSEAGESFYNAVKAKDKTSFKQLMSKDSMEILNAAAQEKKMTLDDLLDKEFFINAAMPAKLGQRNEKLTGDKATTEMLDDKGEWSPMTFVKEGGSWKVSLE
ncbi:MAG: hypothetical protein WKF34_02975 [Pyrinomonadaceae bacterium]